MSSKLSRIPAVPDLLGKIVICPCGGGPAVERPQLPDQTPLLISFQLGGAPIQTAQLHRALFQTRITAGALLHRLWSKLYAQYAELTPAMLADERDPVELLIGPDQGTMQGDYLTEIVTPMGVEPVDWSATIADLAASLMA